MDFYDSASQLEEHEREKAIARRVQYRGASAATCEECLDQIPQARRDAIPGVRLCITCQQDNELRDKTGGGR
ncbi:TraR/DksA C4-type zinc finger protein [Sedimenticola hydrogenitrophicus]|uniref:TraR/DksA C4-type zinc finger protein n=1 Tax=Sedimenticola hydrogenitrophicus TaxID=2967975 RepID=UPI0023B090A3|nr:TraR/DksA C4-type zinc finger protein [Sedimenticola hydrogenitrophicus]